MKLDTLTRIKEELNTHLIKSSSPFGPLDYGIIPMEDISHNGMRMERTPVLIRSPSTHKD